MLAYALLFLPLAQAGLRPALEQVPPAMEEAARACGRPPWRVVFEVTLPNILPGLGAAALLVFLQLMKELTATLVLAPTGVNTLAMALWAQSSQMKYGTAAPYAVLLVLVSGLPAYLATAGWLARETRP
jgi:iron(III) transport system permease protein